MYKQSINSEWTFDKNTLSREDGKNCKKTFFMQKKNCNSWFYIFFTCNLLYQTLSKEVLNFLLVFIVLQYSINRIFH